MAGFGKPLKYFHYYFPIVNDCQNNSYCLFQMLWMRYNTQNASHYKSTHGASIQYKTQNYPPNTKKLFIYFCDRQSKSWTFKTENLKH